MFVVCRLEVVYATPIENVSRPFATELGKRTSQDM